MVVSGDWRTLQAKERSTHWCFQYYLPLKLVICADQAPPARWLGGIAGDSHSGERRGVLEGQADREPELHDGHRAHGPLPAPQGVHREAHDHVDVPGPRGAQVQRHEGHKFYIEDKVCRIRLDIADVAQYVFTNLILRITYLYCQWHGPMTLRTI